MTECNDVELLKEEREHWLALIDHPNRLLRRVANARLSHTNCVLIKLMNRRKREQEHLS